MTASAANDKMSTDVSAKWTLTSDAVADDSASPTVRDDDPVCDEAEARIMCPARILCCLGTFLAPSISSGSGWSAVGRPLTKCLEQTRDWLPGWRSAYSLFGSARLIAISHRFRASGWPFSVGKLNSLEINAHKPTYSIFWMCHN